MGNLKKSLSLPAGERRLLLQTLMLQIPHGLAQRRHDATKYRADFGYAWLPEITVSKGVHHKNVG